MIKEKFILPIGLLFFLCAAFFSKGYFHADEHFQLLEFANYALENQENPIWEYQEKIRPSAQVWMTILIVKSSRFFGIVNPFDIALILRIFSALLGFTAIGFFVAKSKDLIKTHLQPYYTLFSFLLFFMPLLMCRFSSENYSGLLVCFAATLVLSKKRKYPLIGLLLGLAFLFRFQSILFIGGLGLYMLLIERIKIAQLGKLLSTFTLVLAIGIMADSLFYGEFTFSFWNYLKINLLEDKVSSFGIMPWYGYLHYLLKHGLVVFGLLPLLALVILVFKDYKNPLVWGITAFVMFHLLIGHKELRFLFPMAYFCSFLVFRAFSMYTIQVHKNLKMVFMFLVISLNSIALFVTSTKPASKGKIEILQYLLENHSNENHYHLNNNVDPYSDANLSYTFYNIVAMKSIPLEDYSALNSGDIVITYRSDNKNLDALNEFQKIKQSVPQYLETFLDLHPGFKTGQIIEVYQKK